ncbi:MAG: hypothetical protein ACJA2W_003724 [Planctomycetota bacterium]
MASGIVGTVPVFSMPEFVHGQGPSREPVLAITFFLGTFMSSVGAVLGAGGWRATRLRQSLVSDSND